MLEIPAFLQTPLLQATCPVTRQAGLFFLPVSEPAGNLLNQFALGDLQDCYTLYGPTLKPRRKPVQQQLSMATTPGLAYALDKLLKLSDWDTQAALRFGSSPVQIQAKNILTLNQDVQEQIERFKKNNGMRVSPGRISSSSQKGRWYMDGCQVFHEGIRERVFSHTTGRTIHVIRPEERFQPCLVGFSQGWAQSLMIYFYIEAHTTPDPEQYLPEVAFIVTRSELPEGLTKRKAFERDLQAARATRDQHPWPDIVSFGPGDFINLSDIVQRRRGTIIYETAFWKLMQGATLHALENGVLLTASFVSSRRGLPVQDLVTCHRFEKTIPTSDLTETTLKILRASIFQKQTHLLRRCTA